MWSDYYIYLISLPETERYNNDMLLVHFIYNWIFSRIYKKIKNKFEEQKMNYKI